MTSSGDTTFERLLDAMPDAMVMTGADGKILLLNHQAEVLFGWTNATFAGKPVELLLPERFRDRHVQHRMLFAGSPRVRAMGAGLELLALHSDGREIPVEISLSPVEFRGGMAVISTVRDVSVRKAAEREREQVFETEQAVSARLQAIQMVTDAALGELEADALLSDLLGRVRTVLRADTAVILLVDEPAERLVARAALGLEEEIEHHVSVPLGAGFAGRVATLRRPVMIEDIDAADVVNPLLRGKGVRSLLGVPLVVDGLVLGVLHVGSLTRRRFTESEVELLQLVADRVALALDRARLFEEAQAAVRLRNEFLSALSHDLGNPIAAIRLQSRFLREGLAGGAEPAADLAGGLEQIEKTARQAWDLIEELLDLARLQVGRSLELNWSVMDLVATARAAVAACQSTTEQHQIQLELHVQTLLGEWDAVRLERVIANLLANAVKYSPTGGAIVVRLWTEGDGEDSPAWAIMQVRDQGIGIPAAELPHIFERFRRGSNVTGRFPGTGIGLSIAQEIIEHHGGTLSVESQEGAGTTVTVRLPTGNITGDL